MTDPRPRAQPGSLPRDDAGTPGATEVIARFAVRARPGGPPATADAVATALVDTVGVTVAGTRTDAMTRLLGWLRADGPAPGRAPVWGTGLRLSPSQAALLNGTAAHALDWDDASPSMPMHPAAVLLPALLAQAAATPIDGPTLVRAFDIGSAVFRAVSQALPVGPHYDRGWHNTSTSGRLAATAALAHAAGLGEDQARHALGIAASTASGSLANFGTMTKPLHAGLAARDAVTAVGLAAAGFTANPAQLEAARGFFAMYGTPAPDYAAELPHLLAGWETAWVDDWTVKPYASCYATHRPIDAALALRPEAAGRIAAVEVVVRRGGLRPLIDHPPRTGLEAKFSLPFTVALALARGAVRLADFTDEALTWPDVRELMAKVSAREDDDANARPYALVRIRLHDGTLLERRVEASRGSPGDPLTPAEIDAKFTEAVAVAGWTEPAARTAAARLRALTTSPDVAAALNDVLDLPRPPEHAG